MPRASGLRSGSWKSLGIGLFQGFRPERTSSITRVHPLHVAKGCISVERGTGLQEAVEDAESIPARAGNQKRTESNRLGMASSQLEVMEGAARWPAIDCDGCKRMHTVGATKRSLTWARQEKTSESVLVPGFRCPSEGGTDLAKKAAKIPVTRGLKPRRPPGGNDDIGSVDGIRRG